MSVHNFKVRTNIKTTAKRKKSFFFFMFNAACVILLDLGIPAVCSKKLVAVFLKKISPPTVCLHSRHKWADGVRQTGPTWQNINVCLQIHTHKKKSHLKQQRVISMQVGSAERVSPRWCSGTEQRSGRTLRAGKPSAHRPARTLGAVWTVSCDEKKKSASSSSADLSDHIYAGVFS